MLIQPDIHELGDKRLDMAEGIAKAKEDNLRQAAKHKVPDQKLLEDAEMARGNLMSWRELIRRVKRINPEILFEKGGMPNAIAVRVIDPATKEKTYISGFYCEDLPEYSSLVVDEHGLPVRETRGWRTVLLSLIRAHHLDPEKVEVMFGPAVGQRTMLWDRSLQAHRR